MQTRILDCPECNGRFEFESDVIPPDITCPQCGKSSGSSSYSALMLCPACHKKLNVPLDLLQEPELICPLCDQTFSTAESLYISELNTDTTISDFAADDILPRQTLQEGDIFDKFRIVRLLGRGGMAEVFLAEHLLFHRQCALKLLSGNTIDPVIAKRFVREAKISNEINHPNIVKVYDIGADNKSGRLFIAMEYVEGNTLSSEVKNGVFTESALREVLSSITNALSELENHRVVHRDIKPSNIMRTNDGTLKLMDLGIAKVESDSSAGELTLTMAQSVIGTPGFASPEQSQSAHATDIRSDIFSLGATLYVLATGQLPFNGQTAIEIILNVMQQDPVSLDTVRPDLSPGLRALIRDMMAKKPDDRPANIAELQKRIATIDHTPPATALKRTQAKQKQSRNTVPSSQNKKWLWPVLLLLVIGFAGFLFWNSLPQASPPPTPVLRQIQPEQKPEPVKNSEQPVKDEDTAKPEPEKAAPSPAPQPVKDTDSVRITLEQEAVSTAATAPKLLQMKYLFYGKISERLAAARTRQMALAEETPSEQVRLMQDFCARQIKMLEQMENFQKQAKNRPAKQYAAQYNAKIKTELESFLKTNQMSISYQEPSIIKELYAGLKHGKLDPMLPIMDNGGYTKSAQNNQGLQQFKLYELLLRGRLRPYDKLIEAATRQGVDFSRIPVSSPPIKNYAATSTFFWWEYGPEDVNLSDVAVFVQKRYDYNQRWRTDKKQYYGGTSWDTPRLRSLLLCGFLDPNMKLPVSNSNLLHVAVDMGDLAMVKDVIGAGFSDFKDPDDSGDTPYIKALYGGYTDIANCLESCHMNTPVSKQNEIQIAFFNAAWQRNQNAIKKAIEQGAEPDHKMRRGLTALQYGCMMRQLNMVKTLLEAGIPPTAKQQPWFQINHPLALAAINDSLPIFKLLLKHKASYMDKATYDWFHSRPIVFVLIELFMFHTKDLIPYFEELFKAGLDPNLVDKDMPQNISPNATLLVEAIWQWRYPDSGNFVRYLLRKGADPNNKTIRGNTIQKSLKIILAR